MSFVNSILIHILFAFLLYISQINFFTKKPNKIEVVPIEIIFEAELAAKTNMPERKVKSDIEKKQVKVKKKKEIRTRKSERIILKDNKSEQKNIALRKKDIINNKKKKVTKKPKVEKNLIKRKPDPIKEELIDLNEISALIDKQKEQEDLKVAQNNLKGGRSPSQLQEVTASDVAKLREALKRCWTPLIGAPNPELLIVKLRMRFNADGFLVTLPQVDNQREIDSSRNPYWQSARRIALSAVVDCQPYNFLSPYTLSQEFILNFDPSQMVGF